MSKIQDNIDPNIIEANSDSKITIVKSTYHSEITDRLTESCISTLREAGVYEDNVTTIEVPGAWEIPYGCQLALKNKPDAVIGIGCIIKGETPHFDFIAKEVSRAIMDLSLNKDIPIIFGILTSLNMEQAKARIKGGVRGDKGVETAQAAIKMINLNAQ